MNLDKLNENKRNSLEFGPTCWDSDVNIPDEVEVVKRPSLVSAGNVRMPGFVAPPGLVYPPPVSSVPSFSVPYPGIDPGLPIPLHTGHLSYSDPAP